MKGKCPFKEVYFVDLPSKIEFIKHSVYPTTRTYHNWLIYEWFFRSLFDKEIYVHHTIESNQFDKTLLLTMNAESAYKSYFKFNSNLNNIEKERFLIINDTNIKSNIDFVTKNNMNYVSFDSSILWNRELDFNFYKELILFFDLDDNYEAANLVHHLWFEGQIRSEQDLVNTVNLMYKS